MSSENPYQAPLAIDSSPSSFPPHASDYLVPGNYRAAKTLVASLTIFFFLGAGIDLILAGMSAYEEVVVIKVLVEEGGEFFFEPGSREETFYTAFRWIGLLMLPVYITTAVLFLVWVNRANKNARALGATQMEFTSGWSVGWFFIPFMNLFKPYQVVTEIYKASHADSTTVNWRNWPVPAFFGCWWGLWIVSNFLGQIEIRSTMGTLPRIPWIGVATSMLGIPLALLALSVVRSIHNHQELKHSRKSGSTPDAPFAPPSSNSNPFSAP